MNDLAQSPDSSRYLLFGRPGGEVARHNGRDDLLAAFACEEEARRAFRQVRLSDAYRDGWAELLSVGTTRSPRRMCWFGDRSPNPPTQRRTSPARSGGVAMQTTQTAAPVAAPSESPGVPRRNRRGPLVAALLGAVLTATVAIVGVLGEDGGGSQAPSTSEKPLIPFVVDGTPAPGPEVGSVDG